ncbi:MAG TPA: tetratricopeptide repeat protein [Blastocatellia bacterium]|nr:tetratricopeptide repeat protein [Blastocatellia bacterium]
MKAKAAGSVPISKSRKSSRAGRKAKAGASTGRTPLYITVGSLAAVVVVCYANSLANGFVFDDHRLVLIEGRPRGMSHFFDMLLYSYRPVRNLSYALDFLIWGDNPVGFHLTNLLIHGANTVLVYFLARRVMGGAVASVVAAVIFAVHPIQTDAVSYISGRRDLLFSLFYVASFLAYLKYRERRTIAGFALFMGLWGLGLLSKEMAVTLPGLIFMWNFCERWGEQEGGWLRKSLTSARKALAEDRWLYALLVAAGLAYMWYMIFERRASGRAGVQGVQYWGGSFYTNVLTVARVHAWYLKQIVFPTPIAQYYGAFEVSRSILEPKVLLSLAVVGAALAWGLRLLKKDRVMSFAILSYFVLLLPVSQIIPHHELVADHYLYLPMACVGLLAARLVEKFSAADAESRRLAYAGVLVVCAVFAVLTIMRNREWKDELSVWQANYESVPNSPRAAHNFGGLLMRRDPRRAEELFRQALANDPDFEPVYLSLAQLYVASKRPKEADELAEQALTLFGSKAGSHILRNPALLRSQLKTVQAAARWEMGDHAATERLLNEAITEYAPNMDSYLALANLYRGKDPAREQLVLAQALEVSPNSYEANARLAAALASDKKFDGALARLQKLLTLNPSGVECDRSGPHIAAARSAASGQAGSPEVVSAVRSVEQQCQRK